MKSNNDNLCSTDIGQTWSQATKAVLPVAPVYRHVSDVLINVMAGGDYREKYGLIDTYTFETGNPVQGVFEMRPNEELADLLGTIIDKVICDEHEKKEKLCLKLRDAQLRHRHVGGFQLLYNPDPVAELEHREASRARMINEIEEFLHGIINDIIIDANAGRFPLTQDIIHGSGFRRME